MKILLTLLVIGFLLYVEITYVLPRATNVEAFLLILVNGVIIHSTIGELRMKR